MRCTNDERRTPKTQIRPIGAAIHLAPKYQRIAWANGNRRAALNPGVNQAARACARELAIVGLDGAVGMDWDEVLRVAKLPEYRNVNECKALVNEATNELKIEWGYAHDSTNRNRWRRFDITSHIRL